MTRNTSAKWDDLRIFLEVARQGSVQAAARRLKLDHSTVGRRIEYLESVLTVKLLDRTRKGVVVREEAKALLAHIEQMDMQASSLEDAVAGARATQVVRILERARLHVHLLDMREQRLRFLPDNDAFARAVQQLHRQHRLGIFDAGPTVE